MNAGVFEKITLFNRCMEDVLTVLKAYESTPGFDKGSMETFSREAEQLKSGVNRYFGEVIIREADETATRLDREEEAARGRPAEEEEK